MRLVTRDISIEAGSMVETTFYASPLTLESMHLLVDKVMMGAVLFRFSSEPVQRILVGSTFGAQNHIVEYQTMLLEAVEACSGFESVPETSK